MKKKGDKMRGSSNRIYGVGCLCVLAGGAGLAEISTSNHGCFWLCTIVFALGIAMCVWSYGK